MSDFFVKEENNKNKPINQKKVTSTSTKDLIPPEYIPIKLDSLGKLDAPPILHVKNYTMEDALQLSLATEENTLETTLLVLKNLIKENFDPILLHEEELKEILLTIYANFWSTEIKNYPYPLTEEDYPFFPKEMSEKEKQEYIEGKKFFKINIPIKNIKTKPIHEKFKEPIKIKHNNKTVFFRLSRLRDIVDAKNYINQVFLEEERQFSDIKNAIENNNLYEVSQEDVDSYNDYLKRRTLLLMKVVQSYLLVGINNEKFESLEEKLDNYNNVDIQFWNKYNEVINNYANFGIQEKVKVISPLTKKPVVRRFQFRYVDFLQTLDIQDNSEYIVEFGD